LVNDDNFLFVKAPVAIRSSRTIILTGLIKYFGFGISSGSSKLWTLRISYISGFLSKNSVNLVSLILMAFLYASIYLWYNSVSSLFFLISVTIPCNNSSLNLSWISSSSNDVKPLNMGLASSVGDITMVRNGCIFPSLSIKSFCS